MLQPSLHHIDLVVSSIERSLPFYRDLLAPLGWHELEEVEGERGETISYLTGAADCSFGLRQARSESTSPYDRYSVGMHHLAIRVPSRMMVNERAEWLRTRGVPVHGAEIESGPEEYAYMPGYYAVFFHDPDGMKLEIMHVPEMAA